MKYLLTKWLIDHSMSYKINQLIPMRMEEAINEVFIDKTVNKLITVVVIKAAYLARAIRKPDHIQNNTKEKKQ